MGKKRVGKKLPRGVTKKAMQRRQSRQARDVRKQAVPSAGLPTTAALSSSKTAAVQLDKYKRFQHATRMGIQSAFYVVFFIIFNNLAFSLTAKFLELANLLGFPLSHMSVRSLPKLLRLAARFYRNLLVTDLNSPNEGSVALMFDESTDVNSNKTLIVILRMLKNGKPVELFVDNLLLLDGTAEGIVNSLLEGLVKLGIDMELLKTKLISVGTDGASVMTGCINGVGMQLKRAGYKKIISVHCFAHRVDLVSKDTFLKHASESVRDVIQKCRQIAVHTSTKSRKRFADCCTPGLKRTIPIIETTRWLSHYERTIIACADLRDPLIKFFSNPENKQYDKHGLLKFIASDASFLLLSAVLEIVKIMAALNREFQRSDLTILEACKVLKESEWQLKLCAQSSIRTTTELGRRAVGMTVVDEELQLTNLKAAVASLQKLAESMLANLQIRFSRKPQTERKKVGRKMADVVIEPDPVLKHAFQLIGEYPVGVERLQEMCRFFNIDGEVTETNRKLMLKKVTDIYPVLPPSTAECERGFSQVKLIRTKFRNSLKTETLSNLLLIEINSDNLLLNAPVEELANEWCENLSAVKRASALKREPRNLSPMLTDEQDDANNKSGDDEESGGAQSGDNDDAAESVAEEGVLLSELGNWMSNGFKCEEDGAVTDAGNGETLQKQAGMA